MIPAQRPLSSAPAHAPAASPFPVPLLPAPAPFKGRGTASLIAHRFQREGRECADDGWGGLDETARETHEPPATQVVLEQAKSILSKNDSPDIPFTYALNPYRGCEHGCIYCYARPTHSYLNLSPGLDFETRLIAKVNAAACLERELSKPGYAPSPISIGSATDAYQPVERELKLTRAVLQVLTRCEHPFTIITKSAGVLRDVDLIAPAAQRGQAQVFVSLTTLDTSLSRVLEPRAAAPARRLDTIRRLSEAGIPVAVNIAPIIPFLNEPEIERLAQLPRIIDHRARLPMEIVGVAFPCDAMRVEEQAGPRREEEFVDLARYVAQIDVGGVGVAHVGRSGAAEIDMDVRRGQHRGIDPPRPIDPQAIDRQHEAAMEQHHVRREDQIVAIVVQEMVEHRTPVAIPG